MVEVSRILASAARCAAPVAAAAGLAFLAAACSTSAVDGDGPYLATEEHFEHGQAGEQSLVSLGSTGPQQAMPDAWAAPITAAASETPLTAQHERQLQIFGQILLNPSAEIDAETRRNAAQELLAMDLPQAREILAQALRSEKPVMMQAAITAMQSAPQPVDSLMEPAIAALPTAPATVVESLSWAVARYGEPARARVADLALNRSAPVAARLGPIAALSAFDSQAAASSLMQIVNEPAESPEILAAAAEGLQRISGLSHGADVPQWRAWWKQAGSLPAGQWSAFIAKSLSKRAAQLQQDLQKQREANSRLSRELFAAYRDLYPSLPIDEQLRRLPTLLQDQLAPVREFAISRVSLLLRDSVRIPPEVQHKLADRLGDEVPSLRVQAANLLDELNYEAAGPLIAERIRTESSSQVIAAWLGVLQRRPCAEAVEPPIKWLTDPDLGDAALAVIWACLEVGANGQGQIKPLADSVRQALDQRSSPTLLRLLAWIGEEDDVNRLLPLLDDAEPAVRAAVAEGFCRRGLRQPLIDRVDDLAVFPFAVRCVSEGPADLVSFGLLVGWKPDEQWRLEWTEGVAKLVERLPPTSLVAADDVLAAAAHVESELRLAVLSRAAALPGDELPADQRRAVIVRLAPMLIERGDAAHAYALINGLNCQLPELQAICFQASALSGHFDKAIEVQKDAAAWVALLAQAAQRDLQSAAPLYQEITRRFDGRLDPPDQLIVDDIARQLQERSDASARVDGNPDESTP